MRRTTGDLVTLAMGLAALVVSAFFLVADDPGLDDVGTVLAPIALVVAGVAVLVGGIRSRSDGDGPPGAGGIG